MITIKILGTPISFTVEHREDIYESLKAQLYPLHRPSDRLFRFHMFSNAAKTLNDDIPNHELIDALFDSGYLKEDTDGSENSKQQYQIT